MSLVARLRQHRQLQASATEALRTNLPLVQGPLASIPAALPTRPRVPPLGDEHLVDLWPDGLRDAQSEEYAKLYNDFRWIADVAGYKIHELDRSAPAPGRRAQALAHIVEEARAFAVVAVESLQGHRRSAYAGATNIHQGGGIGASAEPTTERLRASVDDQPVDDASEQVWLDRIVAFVARQEPQISWAAGDRSDGTTILVCDLAFGWIPPRVALPVDVELLPAPTSRNRMAIEELLSDVTRRAVYKPGNAITKGAALMSISAPRASTTIGKEDLFGDLLREAMSRDGTASAVRAVIAEPAAGGPVAVNGLQGVVAHVDAARRQLFSDYPLLDESVLGDCLLLSAIESCLIGDDAAATYHYRWFEALVDGGQ
ncbi:DUF5631 domain-containing protein [soil metagenome]